jgi:hypothetical protein
MTANDKPTEPTVEEALKKAQDAVHWLADCFGGVKDRVRPQRVAECLESLDNLIAAVRAEHPQVGHVRCFWCHEQQECRSHHAQFLGEHKHPYRHDGCKPGLLHDAEVRLADRIAGHERGNCGCPIGSVREAACIEWEDEARAEVEPEQLVRPIPEVHEKVLPGEPMPEGQCPDCDAMVYKKGAVWINVGGEEG